MVFKVIKSLEQTRIAAEVEGGWFQCGGRVSGGSANLQRAVACASPFLQKAFTAGDTSSLGF